MEEGEKDGTKVVPGEFVEMHEEEAYVASPIKSAKLPKEPKAEQIDSHNTGGHTNTVGWCAACIAGRGKSLAHKQMDAESSHSVPHFSIDYCFMGDEENDAKNLPILVCRDHGHRCTDSHAVPSKGVQSKYPEQILSENILQTGYPELILKSDQEASILALKSNVMAILKKAGVKVTAEESPISCSSADANVERAIWEVQSMVRIFKHRLEEMHKIDIPQDHPILTWAVEYAGQMLTRGQISKVDGLTGYERRKGKPYRRALPEFGEAIMYMPVKGNKKNKLEDRFVSGIYVGLVERSNEIRVGIENGSVVAANSFRRLQQAQRSNPELIKKIRGTPWKPSSSSSDSMLQLYIDARSTVPRTSLPPAPVAASEDFDPKRVYIRREVELKQYGYSVGCKGCEAARSDLAPTNHSEDCRARITQEMAKYADGRQRLETADTRAVQSKRGASDANDEWVCVGSDEEEATAKRVRFNEELEDEILPMEDGKEGGEKRSASEALAESLRTKTARTMRPVEKRGPMIEAEVSPAKAMKTGAASSSSGKADMSQVEICALQEEIMGLRKQLGCKKASIGEVFCTDRFSREAPKFKLDTTFCLDLTHGWDLDDPRQRAAAEELQKRTKPTLLIGSPKCSAFSQLMAFGNMEPSKYADLLKQGITHLKWCVKLYHRQMDDGNYFVHEHPLGAKSWHLNFMKEILDRDGVFFERGDMCPFGMTSQDADGEEGRVLKASGWMTNAECIAKEVGQRCSNYYAVDPADRHAHVELIGGKAKQAEVYPVKLVYSILRGFRKQLVKDRKLLCSMDVGQTLEEANPQDGSWDMEKFEEVFDNITGENLPAELVRDARMLELEFMHKLGVYRKVPRSEARGSKLGVKWVDVDKGDYQRRDVRSRLCAKEFKFLDPFMPGTFAATAPLECLKFLISIMQTKRKRKGGNGWMDLRMQLLDVSRAHCHAPVARDLYIELPEEENEGGDMVGQLDKCLYGTRDASAQWEHLWTAALKKLGFRSGTFSPCLLFHEERQIWTFVHGDDFISVGESDGLKWLFESLQEDFIIKEKGVLGPKSEQGKVQELTLLNRIVSYTIDERGNPLVTYEPDPRHVELIIKELGLEGERTKSVATPAEKSDIYLDETPLEGERKAKFRSICMRGNYLSPDRVEIQFGIKEASRHMAQPTVGGWQRLRRIGRFLLGSPRTVQLFELQEPQRYMQCKSDSDWAGCVRSRKSTSSSYLFHGRHLLRASSTTQVTPALSSGEAEFYALVKAASIGLGAVHMAKDWGMDLRLKLFTDSSSALGTATRRGVGKIRHLSAQSLWIQQKLADSEMTVEKIKGDRNCADLGTKALDSIKMNKFLRECGYERKAGAALLAKKANV